MSAAIRLTTGPRVELAMVELAKTLGKPQTDGSRRLQGLTHQAIAEYVGTSREIVTVEMNRLRRLGYITYSRRFTDIYVESLAESLRGRGTPILSPTSRAASSHARF